jgi:hypothetical protein
MCERCGPAFDSLADFYGEARSTLYEGPDFCRRIRWQRHRSALLAPEPRPELKQYEIWQRALLRNSRAWRYLRVERGLSDETIERSMIGYGRPNDARPSGFILPQPIENRAPKSYRVRFWPELWQTRTPDLSVVWRPDFRLSRARHTRAQIARLTGALCPSPPPRRPCSSARLEIGLRLHEAPTSTR